MTQHRQKLSSAQSGSGNGSSTERSAPSGKDFLKILSALESKCSRRSNKLAAKPGHKFTECVKNVGTALSLLDRFSSCGWGCKGGDHILEFVAAKVVTTSRASFRLSYLGYYDESLSLTRSVGEIANLLSLFALDRAKFEEWKSAPRNQRLKEFSPASVRRELRQRKTPIIIDDKRYKELCEIGTHITPQYIPQAHNPLNRAVTASVFQEAGLILAVNELALPLVFTLYGVAELADLGPKVALELLEAGWNLADSVGGVSLDYPDKPWFSPKST